MKDNNSISQPSHARVNPGLLQFWSHPFRDITDATRNSPLVIGYIQMSSKHVIGCVHRDCPETPQSSGFSCVAFKASNMKECEDIVCRIGEITFPTVFLSSYLQIHILCFCFLQLQVSSTQSGLYNKAAS